MEVVSGCTKEAQGQKKKNLGRMEKASVWVEEPQSWKEKAPGWTEEATNGKEHHPGWTEEASEWTEDN